MQAFKFEQQPDGEQECKMPKFSGSCRFVFIPQPAKNLEFGRLGYNKALAIQKENYEVGNMTIRSGGKPACYCINPRMLN